VGEQVLWSAMVKAVDGPQLAGSGTIDVEAYDKVDVTVTAGSSQKVDLSPGAVGAIRCLVVLPAVPDADLTYKVGTKDIALDAPHLLLGGAVALAGDPTSLTFKNDTAADAVISILVGRDATP
jgi:hypothetical protein